MKTKLTKRKLLKQLRALKNTGDTERDHVQADNLLIEYIDDPLITKAYDDLDKWYA